LTEVSAFECGAKLSFSFLIAGCARHRLMFRVAGIVAGVGMGWLKRARPESRSPKPDLPI
jgi:hypothetical protein